jgi:DNA-binding SARP family transcriptional activator
MALVTLRLVGPFEARARNGAALALPGKRSIALLAAMADEADGPWSRERLARLIWAGRGEAQARDSLRQELVRLRRALSRALGTELDLWKGSGGLSLTRAIFDVDLVRLRAAAREPRRAHEAARLYRGELLQDYPADESAFGTWLADRRQRLRQSVIGCLLAALTEAAARRDAAGGAAAGPVEDDAKLHELASRLVELEPWC